MIVGAARPHANLSMPRKEATVVLAIDVSRSMTAKDVRPSRLDAARIAANAFLAKVPSTYNVALVASASRAFLAVPPTTDHQLVRRASSLTPGEGTALGDAILLSASVGERRRREEGVIPPTTVLLISDGARQGGQTAPLTAAKRAKALGVTVSTVLVGTPNGIVTATLVGGYQEQIRVPPSPGTLQAVAHTTAASSSARARALRSTRSTRTSRRAWVIARSIARSPICLRGGRSSCCSPPERCRCSGSGGSREARRGRLRGGRAPRSPSASRRLRRDARSARACRSACPVAGPWVLATQARAEFQLDCPKKFIVGGLDAELSSRAVDIGFVGGLGSPVNPGITTTSSAVFLGRVLAAHGAATFRPHIGCMPASGGGRRTPTAYRVVPPGKPTTRVRASSSPVLPRITTRLAAHCAKGKRLVHATNAVGFYGDKPPSAQVAQSVHVTQVGARRRRPRDRAGGAGIQVRTIVQIDLVCAVPA